MTTVTNKATNKDRTPVANDIYTYCTKEKTDTWHVVRNHDAKGLVDRVICKACGSEHKYKKENVLTTNASRTNVGSTLIRRAGGASSLRNSSKSSTPAPMSSAAIEETWLKGIKSWGEKAVPAFSPEQSFAPGEVFVHGSFGKGVVQTRRENKIDVLFREGMKTLPSKK
jgi:hypothetical protein